MSLSTKVYYKMKLYVNDLC